ncbi:MAG: hypothetical protein II951_01565 [Bacteroidales bacterium]|nr:hypothetical protein [Bacteroidales bacterium]
MAANDKAHGLEEVEFSFDTRPYGKDRPYRNKEKSNRKQRDELINKIKQRNYEHAGTDVFTVGDTIFLVDHQSAKTFKMNILIEKFQMDKDMASEEELNMRS